MQNTHIAHKNIFFLKLFEDNYDYKFPNQLQSLSGVLMFGCVVGITCVCKSTLYQKQHTHKNDNDETK